MHIHTNVYVHTYPHTHSYIYIHTYSHIHTHVYIHTYPHTHSYIYIHTYSHIHTHVYIHTYPHTHTHRYPRYPQTDILDYFFNVQGFCGVSLSCFDYYALASSRVESARLYQTINRDFLLKCSNSSRTLSGIIVRLRIDFVCLSLVLCNPAKPILYERGGGGGQEKQPS